MESDWAHALIDEVGRVVVVKNEMNDTKSRNRHPQICNPSHVAGSNGLDSFGLATPVTTSKGAKTVVRIRRESYRR